MPNIMRPSSRGAVLCDGAASYITCGDVLDALLNDWTLPKSISMWVKATSLTTVHGLVGKMGGGIVNGGFALYFAQQTGARLRFGRASSDPNLAYLWQTNTILAPYVVDTPYYITLSISGQNATGWRLYVNGVNTAFQRISGIVNPAPASSANTGELMVGRTTGGPTAVNGYFPGLISKVLITDSVTSQAEHTAMYASGFIEESNAPGTVELALSLNEDSGTVATDTSANGYDGTLTNFTGTFWNPLLRTKSGV